MTSEEHQRAEQAAAAIAALQEVQRGFFHSIEGRAGATHALGTLRVAGGIVSCTCLEVPLEVHGHPVGDGTGVYSMEYAFRAERLGERVLVACLYLDANGNLYTDAALTTRLCDCRNPRVAQEILVMLSQALLRSTLFRPAA